MPRSLFDASELVARIRSGIDVAHSPFIVALDGRSGVGKSTLASTLADALDAPVIDGDDFFAGGTACREDTPALLAATCIDWTKQRLVLESLRSGSAAVWRAFDWDAFDGRLHDRPTRVEPRAVVILEGVYSARPELGDLVDLRVLLKIPEQLRHARLTAREGAIGPWELQWHRAEDAYFESTMRDDAFDLVLSY